MSYACPFFTGIGAYVWVYGEMLHTHSLARPAKHAVVAGSDTSGCARRRVVGEDVYEHRCIVILA